MADIGEIDSNEEYNENEEIVDIGHSNVIRL